MTAYDHNNMPDPLEPSTLPEELFSDAQAASGEDDQPKKPSLGSRLKHFFFADKHPHFDPRDSHNHTPGNQATGYGSAGLRGFGGGFSGGGGN